MRTIKVSFPDISRFQKTRLSQANDFDNTQSPMAQVNPGADSLYFRNTAGFSADDFFIIEAFESGDAEICQIQTVDPGSHIVEIVDQTYQPHQLGTTGSSSAVVMRTPYNKVKVFKGSSGILSGHTEITGSPFPLRPDTSYTFIDDPSGTSADYYSYQFWNSKTSIGAIQTLYSESDYDAVITVQQLRDWFMFGLDLTDDDGYPFPMSMFEFGIRAAVNRAETILNIRIRPTVIYQENQDFFAQDYRDFAFIQLNHYPIISVENVYVWYPTAQAPILFPKEWYQIRKERGQLNLVPTSGSLSTILMGRGGDYLTFVWRGYDFMPNLWRIDYTAGLGHRETPLDGGNSTGNIVTEIPDDLIGVIGKMACFFPLEVAGDLVGGIAIASRSTGIDGLSQSINTTSCVHPDTLVLVDGKYKRICEVGVPTKFWDGDLISFFVKGKDNNPTMVTPDHLILTDSGWKEAGDLSLSDMIDQSGNFESLEKIERLVFEGQLYDMISQPEGKYVTYQGVIHNSPENAGYQARLRQYERDLKQEIVALQRKYWAIKMAAL